MVLVKFKPIKSKIVLEPFCTSVNANFAVKMYPTHFRNVIIVNAKFVKQKINNVRTEVRLRDLGVGIGTLTKKHAFFLKS